MSWWWDDGSTTGRSVLVRTDNGQRGVFSTSGLTPGDAVTLWFIIFNNPAACSTSPCSVPADVFDEEAGADFYWADGRIVGPAGTVTLVGGLAVGQTAHSGKVEVGIGEAVPLTNPHGWVPGVQRGGPADLPDAAGECATLQRAVRR